MAFKYTNSSLIIKNISTNRAIKILGMKLNPGQEADLFKSIVGLTEERVISAMQKPNGVLYKAVARGDILVSNFAMATFENDPGITVWKTLMLTSDYTASSGSVLLCDASNGNLVITLPSSASIPGRVLQVKKIDSSANTVTIQCTGANTLDGLANFVIEDEHFSLTIVSGGSNYYII